MFRFPRAADETLRRHASNVAAVFSNFRCADGRTIDVLRGGNPERHAPALVLHHGTPADASLWAAWDAVARESGVALVALSRPGYGGSTRLRGRRVADIANDVDAVLAHIGAPWCVTAGWSGGGPHALATAALLGDRCRAAATLAGVGRYDAPDLDFLAGMGPENHAEFGAAVRGEAELATWLEQHASAFRNVRGQEIVAAFGGLIAQRDKDVLSGGFAEELAAVMRRALADGFDGWIDDDLAFVRPWGFAVEGITVPVTVWQGDEDLMVPAAHGGWLATHIPTAVARPAPGHGHLSLITTYARAIASDLVTRAS